MDRPGVLRKDYQTAQLYPHRVESETALSSRQYFSDAVFLVGLEGEEALLRQLDEALRDPHWPMALGRKSYPPSAPVALEGSGLRETTLRQALSEEPRLKPQTYDRMRLVLETADSAEGSLRYDVPTASFSERRFGPRYVTTNEYCNPGGTP